VKYGSISASTSGLVKVVAAWSMYTIRCPIVPPL
jgi:hypothetical protein